MSGLRLKTNKAAPCLRPEAHLCLCAHAPARHSEAPVWHCSLQTEYVFCLFTGLMLLAFVRVPLSPKRQSRTAGSQAARRQRAGGCRRRRRPRGRRRPEFGTPNVASQDGFVTCLCIDLFSGEAWRPLVFHETSKKCGGSRGQ